MPWPVACKPSPGLIKKVTGVVPESLSRRSRRSRRPGCSRSHLVRAASLRSSSRSTRRWVTASITPVVEGCPRRGATSSTLTTCGISAEGIASAAPATSSSGRSHPKPGHRSSSLARQSDRHLASVTAFRCGIWPHRGQRPSSAAARARVRTTPPGSSVSSMTSADSSGKRTVARSRTHEGDDHRPTRSPKRDTLHRPPLLTQSR